MSETKKPSNRPDDSAFKQQRLKAWQPILTPLFVIGTFLCIGIVFIPIGIVLKMQGDGVFESTSVYDGKVTDVATANLGCRISTQNEGYHAIQNGTAKTCTLSFTFTKDLPAGATVEVFYQLTDFYQNHRRYVKSRSDDQVAGKFVSPSTLSTLCDPNASYVAPEGRVYAPCGLIATSVFNDAFFLKEFNGGAAKGTGVVLEQTNIAWSSDLSGKFFNPTGAALNAWGTYRYLWQTYDQMSCYTDDTYTTRTQCLTWANVTSNSTVYGTGCAKCASPTDVFRYEGGIPPPGAPTSSTPPPGSRAMRRRSSVSGTSTSSTGCAPRDSPPSASSTAGCCPPRPRGTSPRTT